MMAALRKAYRWDLHVRSEGEGLPKQGIAVRARDIVQGVVYQRDGVKVTAFTVDHGGLLKPAFGYRVDAGGRSVVLSSDTRPSENLVKYARGADVVIHEVAAIPEQVLAKSATARGILALHTSPEQAGEVFTRIAPKLGVYTHLVLLSLEPAIPAPTLETLVSRTRTTYTGPLVVGEDLLTITLGDEVTTAPARLPQ